MNITVTLRAHDNTLPVDELAAFADYVRGMGVEEVSAYVDYDDGAAIVLQATPTPPSPKGSGEGLPQRDTPNPSAERKPDLFADPFGRLKKTSSQGEG